MKEMNEGGKTVLAFDLGASSGRAVLGTLQEDRIELVEVHRFTNDPVTVNGGMYWDTLRQFHEIKGGLKKASQVKSYESIGIDSWGVDFGLLDQDGYLLENAVHYRDGRTEGICEEVFRFLSKEEIYEITGNQVMEINTLFQLYALKKRRPQVMEYADSLLLIPDLFTYFLTGEKRAEYTMASTTQMMNVSTGKWSEELLELLGLSDRIKVSSKMTMLLPEIVSSGTVIGSLLPDICSELKIHSVPVIAVAAHDTQSAMAAIPTRRDDFLFISCGTWGLIGTELSEPIISKKALDCNMTNEGAFGGRISFLKNITGLWLIQESRRQWQREGKEYSFSELEILAQGATPLQSFIDPDAPEFATSGNIPERIQDFCRRTNQPIPLTPGEIVICINQSLALAYRNALEQIEECTGKMYPNIHMVGGGTHSTLLCGMVADAANRPVIAGPAEAAALGNIIVQLITLGEISDMKAARGIVRNSFDLQIYQPKDAKVWENAYQKVKNIIKKEHKNG